VERIEKSFAGRRGSREIEIGQREIGVEWHRPLEMLNRVRDEEFVCLLEASQELSLGFGGRSRHRNLSAVRGSGRFRLARGGRRSSRLFLRTSADCQNSETEYEKRNFVPMITHSVL